MTSVVPDKKRHFVPGMPKTKLVTLLPIITVYLDIYFFIAYKKFVTGYNNIIECKAFTIK